MATLGGRPRCSSALTHSGSEAEMPRHSLALPSLIPTPGLGAVPTGHQPPRAQGARVHTPGRPRPAHRAPHASACRREATRGSLGPGSLGSPNNQRRWAS